MRSGKAWISIRNKVNIFVHKNAKLVPFVCALYFRDNVESIFVETQNTRMTKVNPLNFELQQCSRIMIKVFIKFMSLIVVSMQTQ